MMTKSTTENKYAIHFLDIDNFQKTNNRFFVI